MSTGHARTLNYIKQLKGSAVYKLGAIVASFLSMPIMIKYLGPEKFGVWATMLTLITWIMLFDLGIGNGLKNNVAESLAEDKPDQAAGYISTAYILIGCISLALFALFLVLSFWLPWQSIFNIQAVAETDLKKTVILLGFFVFFNFWISLVNQIYHGLQLTSIVVFGQFLSNFLSLLFVFFLYKFTVASLEAMVWVYGLSLVSVNLLLSFILFKKRNNLKPSFRLFDKDKVRVLFSLGLQFFVIQIAVLVIFMTDKILITQLLGPEHVMPYEVLFKLFSVFTVAHGLILAPLWPAYSDAYSRKDFIWIKSILTKQIYFALFGFCLIFVVAALAPIIVEYWIGNDVNVSYRLCAMFAVFMIVSIWSNIFSYFVNAIGQLGIQLFTAVLAAAINIPVSIYFVSVLELGLVGIVLATVISLSFYALLGPVQVFKIINGFAK